MGVSVSSLKAPQITSLSSSSTQAKYWEDVLTSHSDDSVGRTWRVQEKRMGAHIFEVEEGVVQVSPAPAVLCHNASTELLGGLRDGVR